MYPVEVQWHFQSHLMYHQESPWSSEGLNQALCQKKLVCVRVLKNMSMYLDNVSNTIYDYRYSEGWVRLLRDEHSTVKAKLPASGEQ